MKTFTLDLNPNNLFPGMEYLGWEIGYPSGNNQQVVRSKKQTLCEKLEFKHLKKLTTLSINFEDGWAQGQE